MVDEWSWFGIAILCVAIMVFGDWLGSSMVHWVAAMGVTFSIVMMPIVLLKRIGGM